MALLFYLRDVLKATLPQGYGHVGFIGVAPEGREYHVLSPVELDLALGAVVTTGSGDGLTLGGHAHWSYLLCQTYRPPPPSASGGPDQAQVSQARLRQARFNGQRLVSWARSQGWWAELQEDGINGLS